MGPNDVYPANTQSFKKGQAELYLERLEKALNVKVELNDSEQPLIEMHNELTNKQGDVEDAEAKSFKRNGYYATNGFIHYIRHSYTP